MYHDTAELREGLRKLLVDLEAGKVSNSAARARVTIAKAILDTVKVELAAAALGMEFHPIPLGVPTRSAPKLRMGAVAETPPRAQAAE